MNVTLISRKQQLCAHYYIQNHFSDIYDCAIKAGYSQKTAKNAHKNIMESRGFKNYLKNRDSAAARRSYRRKLSDEDVIANLYRKATGISYKRTYKKIDKHDPGNSENAMTNAPAPEKIQVKAIKLWLQYKGLLHSDSADVEAVNKAKTKSQIAKIKADTKLVKSKLPNADNNTVKQPPFIKQVAEYYHKNHGNLNLKEK